MAAAWDYPETAPMRVQGRGLAEDNFAQETKTPLSILIREAIQNPLDARREGNDDPVFVRFGVYGPGEFDSDYLRTLLPEEYFSRLGASGANINEFDFDDCNVLVMEDFGTTGLLGSYTDPNVDGDTENWNAFWLREGEGAKTGGSNGRAGQGKITYYRVGHARAIFGITVRSSDNLKIMMGRSSFRRVYPYGPDNKKYERDAFWCEPEETGIPLPSTDVSQMDSFCKAFNLNRGDEPGLSLVIPFAEKIDIEDALRTVIAEFYYPIARGRLKVEVAMLPIITRENVDELADEFFPDEKVHQYSSSFTKDYRKFIQEVIADEEAGVVPVKVAVNWRNKTNLIDEIFPEESLEAVKQSFEKGERISVRFPVFVRPKAGDQIETWFDVHLQVPEELSEVHEAYLRRDLLIDKERHLKKATHLPRARGVTLIEDKALSAFLADAEEPTHLMWNGSRPRLAEDYKNPGAVVSNVRLALPKLLTWLSGASLKRDTKALAKYFTKPIEAGRKAPTPGKDPGKKVEGEKPIIPSTPKPFKLDTEGVKIKIRPNPGHPLKPEQLPIRCELSMEYKDVDGKGYDPFDFDISDTDTHTVTSTGITELSRNLNEYIFNVTDASFEVDIDGFDENMRLHASLDYEEERDEATVDNE
ncbi:MAG: hypothetical protein C0623_06610 [Desulfuromonas sp.]|nr:MAG: hypothetical protein C0623_06610 [Desulfuromonas sp.]